MKTTLKNTTWVIISLFILLHVEISAQGFKSVLESKIKADRNTLNLEMKGAYEPFKVIVKVNEKLESNPELINSDPFGEGWIAEISNVDRSEPLLSAAEYASLTA